MADKFLASIKAKSDVPSESGPVDVPAETGGTGAVEEGPTIVLDCGSGFCRIGYAGHDNPKHELHAMVGRPKQQVHILKLNVFPLSMSKSRLCDSDVNNCGATAASISFKLFAIIDWISLVPKSATRGFDSRLTSSHSLIIT